MAYRLDNTRYLRVGCVLYNDKNSLCINIHAMTTEWKGMTLIHRKKYIDHKEEGDVHTTTPTNRGVEETVFYAALVKKVELKVDGTLLASDVTTLNKGGWAFKLEEKESIRALTGMVAFREELDRRDARPGSPLWSDIIERPELTSEMFREEQFFFALLFARCL